jgi:hypothetical protein
LEHDRLESQRQLTILEGAHQTLQKERDELHSDVRYKDIFSNRLRFMNEESMVICV